MQRNKQVVILSAAKDLHTREILRYAQDDSDLKKSSGFTLIELLIVILIISIVSATAVLSININQDKKLQTFTTELTNLLQLAEQEAMLRPATIGVAMYRNQIRFYQYHPTDATQNPWQLISDPILTIRNITADMQITLKIQGKVVASAHPAIIMTNSGDITPFAIFIGKKEQPARYQIIGYSTGQIQQGIVNEEE